MFHIILSLVQTRIILALLLGENVATTSVLRVARISGTTWSREREVLANMGLINGSERKVFVEGGVRRVKNIQLTEKGREIARHIQSIHQIIEQSESPVGSQSPVRP